MIPLDEQLRPTWLFGKTVHEGCDRAGYYEQADFALGLRLAQVPGEGRLLGPGGQLQRAQARLDERHRRLPERRRHLHRAARCRASPTSSCRSWTSRRARRSRRRSSRRTAGSSARSARSPIARATKSRSGTTTSPCSQRATTSQWPKEKSMTLSSSTPRERTPPRRDVVGSGHAHHRQPRHLHEDRLRQSRGRRVQEHVVDVPRLQRLHARQGSARLALHHEPHLRHLRRQPRDLLGLRAEHGVRHQDAAARRVDLQPRRGRRVHVRPLDLPGQPRLRRLLRADGEGDEPGPARARRADRGAARGHPRVPDDRATSCARSTRSPGRSTGRRFR